MTVERDRTPATEMNETEYLEIEPRYTAVAEAEAAALLRRWAPGVENPEALASYLVAVVTGPIAAGTYYETLKITRDREETHLDLARFMAVEEVTSDIMDRARFALTQTAERAMQHGLEETPQLTSPAQ